MSKSKSIQYMFRTEGMSDREVEEKKEAYAKKGMRVAVLTEGRKDIHEALKGVALNHV